MIWRRNKRSIEAFFASVQTLPALGQASLGEFFHTCPRCWGSWEPTVFGGCWLLCASPRPCISVFLCVSACIFRSVCCVCIILGVPAARRLFPLPASLRVSLCPCLWGLVSVSLVCFFLFLPASSYFSPVPVRIFLLAQNGGWGLPKGWDDPSSSPPLDPISTQMASSMTWTAASTPATLTQRGLPVSGPALANLLTWTLGPFHRWGS